MLIDHVPNQALSSSTGRFDKFDFLIKHRSSRFASLHKILLLRRFPIYYTDALKSQIYMGCAIIHNSIMVNNCSPPVTFQ